MLVSPLLQIVVPVSLGSSVYLVAQASVDQCSCTCAQLRERDELVAQHVFRWGLNRILGTEELPPFSSDFSAAWQVVDAFPDLRFTLERFETSGRVSALFRDIEGRSAFEAFMHMGGDIVPSEAICMAGLLAAGFNPASE